MSDIQQTFGHNAEPQESVRARLGISEIVDLIGEPGSDDKNVVGAWDTPVRYEVAIPLIVRRVGEDNLVRCDVAISDFEQLSRDPGLSDQERAVVALANRRYTQLCKGRALGINS